MSDPHSEENKLKRCTFCLSELSDSKRKKLGLRVFDNWANKVLPSPVRMSDIDGVVERNGRVLIVELKPAGAELPLGQRLMLRTFVGMGCTVWVVWEGKLRTVKGVLKGMVQVGAMDERGDVPFVQRMSVARLETKLDAWYESADRAA
jgi:hypothetical protein